MNIIETKNNIFLDGFSTTVTVVIGDIMPQYAKITAVVGFIFDNGKLLMTNLKKNNRGWDIPGGHVEKGEMPEQAFIREVHEETGAIIKSPRNFGYIQFHVAGEIPIDYQYSFPDTYIVLYIADYISMGAFSETQESYGREFKDIDEVRKTSWYKESSVLFEYVIENIKVLNIKK